MDEVVNMLIAATCLALSCAGANAQGLPDPTLRATATAASTAAGGRSAAQLQSVLIARGTHGRRVAVISGQILRVGDAFEGAVLASISENQVVLRRGKTLRILKLSSVLPMQPAAAESAAPAAPAE